MLQAFYIPVRLPGMNDIIDARMKAADAGKNGRRWNPWSEMKRENTKIIDDALRNSGVRHINSEMHFSFLFLEPNKRRDPDNIVSGGMKIIFDAICGTGLMSNDGWRNVGGISPSWHVDGHNTGCWVAVDAKGHNKESMMEIARARG